MGSRQGLKSFLCCLAVDSQASYLPWPWLSQFTSLQAYLAAKTAAVTTYTENDIDGLDLEKIGVPGSGTIVPEIYAPKLPEPGQIIKTGSVKTDVGRLMSLLGEKGSV